MAQNPDRKELRRKALERKRKDKEKRHNPVAKNLRTSKYRLRIEEEKKERGGSKNPFNYLNEEE